MQALQPAITSEPGYIDIGLHRKRWKRKSPSAGSLPAVRRRRCGTAKTSPCRAFSNRCGTGRLLWSAYSVRTAEHCAITVASAHTSIPMPKETTNKRSSTVLTTAEKSGNTADGGNRRQRGERRSPCCRTSDRQHRQSKF